MATERIHICGAGLVGSALAISLAQKGHRVDLTEKRPGPIHGSSGQGRSINLILTRKGEVLLEELGIKEEVYQLGVPVYGRGIHPLNGDQVFQPYGRDQKDFNLSISRNLLNDLLQTKAKEEGVQIYYQASLDQVNFESKSAHYTNGSNFTFDRFFGVDGAGSKARQELQARLGEQMQVKIEDLGVQYKELIMPAGDQQNYLLDKRALHIWPRGPHMLMGLANNDGSFTMTLYRETEKMQKLNHAQAVRDYFKEFYPDTFQWIEDIPEQILENPSGRLASVSCSHWIYQDWFCLMGDASHAIVPFFGQGMNSGLQDVFQLNRLFDQYDTDWSAIMPKFEQKQKREAQAIKEMAVENYDEMASKVGDDLFLKRKSFEHYLEEHFPDLYRSRYGLVVYELCPYAEAQALGEIQERWITQLMEQIEHPSQMDQQKLKSMLKEQIVTEYKQRKVLLADS
jgi:kynurenine 3-monooxygenase